MSGVAQRRKGPKRKQLICTNRSRFKSMEDAKAFITKQRNKGVRRSKTLVAYWCDLHSNRQEDIYHVGQRHQRSR